MVRHWRRLRAEVPTAGGARRSSTASGRSRPGSWRSRSRPPSSLLGRMGRAHPDPGAGRDDAVHRPPVPVGRRRSSRFDRTRVIPRPRRRGAGRRARAGHQSGRGPGDQRRALHRARTYGRCSSPTTRPRRRGSANTGSVSCRDVPLVVVESPYRALVGPLLAYLDVLDQSVAARQGGPDHLRRHPGIRGPELVGADPLQPVGAAAPDGAARPAPHGGRECAVSPRGAGGRAATRRPGAFVDRLRAAPLTAVIGLSCWNPTLAPSSDAWSPAMTAIRPDTTTTRAVGRPTLIVERDDEPFDLYDQGLQADVATLIDRRRVLQLMGLAGVFAVPRARRGPRPPPRPRWPRPPRPPRPVATGEACAPVIPEETAGPFPGDGTNGPDVLTESGVVRSDITHELRRLVGHGRGRPADDPAADPGRGQRVRAARRRRGVRCGTATARAATRCTRRASRTRTTCAASRRRATTGSSRSPSVFPPATRAAGRTSTSRSTRPSRPRPTPPTRSRRRRSPSPRTSRTRSTRSRATRRASRTCSR